MKMSDWRVGAMLVNVAVICLAYPEGGRENHIHVPAGHRIGAGGHILPNDKGTHDRDVRRTYDAELSTIGAHESSLRGSQDGGSHNSIKKLNDEYSALSESEIDNGRRKKGGALTRKYSTFKKENGIENRFRVHSGSGAHLDGNRGLSGGHSDPENHALHGKIGESKGGRFDFGNNVHAVGGSHIGGAGGSHIGGAGGNTGSDLKTLNGNYVSPGAVKEYGGLGRKKSEIGGSGSTHGRGSAPTATISFNLGAPLQNSGGYNVKKGINSGAYSGGSRASAYDSDGNIGISTTDNDFVADGSSSGGGGFAKGYNKKGNVDGTVHTNGNYGEVRDTVASGGAVTIGGGYGDGGGVGVEDAGRGEGGGDGGIGISTTDNGFIADSSSGGGGFAKGYNKKGNVDGTVHTNGNYGEVRDTVAIGGGGVNIGGGYVDGSGVVGGDAGRGADVGGGGGSVREEYNPEEGNRVLVGGRVGGVYVTSKDESNSVSAFGQGELPVGGYSIQTESSGGISAAGYSAPKENKGNGSEVIYRSPADAGGDSGLKGRYSSVGGIIGSQSDSIVQSGILEAEYSAPDNSGGYWILKKGKAGRRYYTDQVK